MDKTMEEAVEAIGDLKNAIDAIGEQCRKDGAPYYTDVIGLAAAAAQAFGAPGAWGYGTSVAEALAKLYSINFSRATGDPR